jgi:NAD(P)-dependent dehydrogenase (short-subunit alcohol dehydrogenase family)
MILTDAVAIVTGSSRGIGRAIADALKEAGVTVEGADRDTMDVRDHDQVHRYIEGVVARRGRIDILVNNAGWAEPLGILEQVTDEQYDQCMDTNVKGVFHCLQAVLPIMKKQNSGIVINVASRAGSKGHPGLAVYSASKFAVRGLTQAVARECAQEGKDIQVISLSPGGVDTDMRAALFGKEDSERQQKPEEIAKILLQYLQGDVDASSGSDVQVIKGAVARIVSLDS